MFTDFHPIPTAKLAAATAIHIPQQRLPERVSLNDPAIDVMTDLSRVAAVTIDAGKAAKMMAIAGEEELQLQSCSRWPAMAGSMYPKPGRV